MVYPKANDFEFDLLFKLLRHHLDKLNAHRTPQDAWQLVTLTGLTHRQVAKLMQESSFFININSREAFNTSVPEAMAAGCIVFCYDAVGGQDFLEDGENAFVFSNHALFPLLDCFFEILRSYNEKQPSLAVMNACAQKTADNYRRKNTADALIDAFNRITLRVRS